MVPIRASWFAVPRARRSRTALADQIVRLAAGTPVVLCDSWFGSRSRCRDVAASAGLTLTREYLALPTLARAVVLLQDQPETARYVADAFLARRPSSGWSARVEAYLMPVVRYALTADKRAALFPGRVVIGVRA